MIVKVQIECQSVLIITIISILIKSSAEPVRTLVCTFAGYDLCGWTVSNPEQAQRSNPFLTNDSTGNSKCPFLFLPQLSVIIRCKR